MARDTELVEVLHQLNILDSELHGRREDIDRFTDYYDGKQPLRFASEQYRQWFGDQYKGFADNWTMPVADAQAERKRFIGIRPKDEQSVSEQLREWWETSGAAEDFPLAMTRETVTGRAFALVWGESDDEGEDTPTVSFEDPSQAIVAYEPGNRRKRRCGLKLWSDPWTGKDFATFYTPDFVYKFQRYRGSRIDSQHGVSSIPMTAGGLLLPDGTASRGGWMPREEKHEPWPLPNPLGEVPLVEFQNKPKLIGEPISEVAGVVSMQDAINALWAFLFTAADYTALPQRAILGAELPKIPVLNENGQKIGEKPIDLPEANVKRILNLEGPNAKIAQWDPANLEIFTAVIEKAANHIGNQTRTPLYYFASSIQNISGDTLKALDTGLISKVTERLEVDVTPTREVNRLMALAADDKALAKSVAAGTIVWKDYEVQSEAQKVDGLQKLHAIGFPFEYLAEKYTGGDADEVARILEMRESEQAQQAEMDSMALLGKAPNGEELPTDPVTGMPAGMGTRPPAAPAEKKPAGKPAAKKPAAKKAA